MRAHVIVINLSIMSCPNISTCSSGREQVTAVGGVGCMGGAVGVVWLGRDGVGLCGCGW